MGWVLGSEEDIMSWYDEGDDEEYWDSLFDEESAIEFENLEDEASEE